MESEWTEELVADQISKYLTARRRQGKEAMIDTIITFDEHGCSHHPNHIAVHKGVSKVIRDHQFNLDCYCLKTAKAEKAIYKYLSYSAIVMCDYNDFNLFTVNMLESWRALALHATQFVWYRKLSIIFSQNTFMNSFDYYVQTKPKKEEEKPKKVNDDDLSHA